MTNKSGQLSAFPYVYHRMVKGEDTVEVYTGMSRRLLLAGMAMQGIISYSACGMMIPPNAAKLAFEFADELLKQESE